jgi:hypothetical protein
LKKPQTIQETTIAKEEETAEKPPLKSLIPDLATRTLEVTDLQESKEDILE